MDNAVSHVVLIVLAALVVLAMVSVVRGSLRGVPKPKPAEFKPFIDFPPPPEVVATPGVRRLAWAAVVWATLNIGGLMAWAASGFVVPKGDEMGISAVQIVTIVGYLFVAATLAGVGGLLLLACRAQGRRMLAWSGFLFVTISMLGMGLALIGMASKESIEIRELARLAAVAVVAHFIVDTVVATMAQRVGLPKAAAQPAEEQ